MEKIRVNNDDKVYKIEVNDKGEYIEFDLMDIELPIKLMKLAEDIEKNKNIYQTRLNDNEKKNQDDIKKQMLEQYEISKKYCEKMRGVFDEFFGEGSSEKIFGSKNKVNMFEEFFDQLIPHLDKIQLDVESIRKDLVERYKPYVDKAKL